MMCALDYMPFIYSRNGDKGFRVDVKGIIQGLLVAAVTGMVVMYGTQQVISEQLEAIRDDVIEIKYNQRQFRIDFYSPQNGNNADRR